MQSPRGQSLEDVADGARSYTGNGAAGRWQHYDRNAGGDLQIRLRGMVDASNAPNAVSADRRQHVFPAQRGTSAGCATPCAGPTDPIYARLGFSCKRT